MLKALTALCLIYTYSMYINAFSKDTLYQFTVDTHMWCTLVVLTAVRVDVPIETLKNSAPYLHQMCGEALSLVALVLPELF